MEAGAVGRAVQYVEDRGYAAIVIAADAHTCVVGAEVFSKAVAGKGIQANIAVISPDRQGDVIADEASVVELLLEIQQTSAEAVIAFGAGTLHDIARYAAYTAGLPLISIPTAASVDGFTSTGAPLILRGVKKTIQAIGPDAIFADLDILVKAPKALVAAGFGDMLGKYTSLFDWSFGRLAAGESYMPEAAELTRSALQCCVTHAGAIAKGEEEGIAVLIRALIDSGQAIRLFGESHPASGAEHHLSHYWEMEYLRLGRKQLLHGAKVGVASVQISGLYHRIEQEGLELAVPHTTALEGQEAGTENAGIREAVRGHWAGIGAAIKAIPDARELTELLRQVGGPATPEELGVEAGLVQRSLREAHRVRLNRYTLLRFFNEAGQRR